MAYSLIIRLLFSIAFVLLWFNPAVAIPPGLKFIQNKTQWPAPIHFFSKVRGGSLFLQSGQFTYSFLDQRKIEELHEQSHGKSKERDSHNPLNDQIDGQIIQSIFIGSNANSVPIPFEQYPEYYNYFLGSDETNWSSDVHAYQGAWYPDIYSDIDLKIYSQEDNLKYDFVVAPGADVSQIIFEYKGADRVFLDNGNLHIKTLLAELIERRPFAYQLIEGKQRQVKCEYELIGNQISFCLVDGYDPCYELVIDPLLIFSTYSGSSADNWGSTATPGEHGTLYSSGVTSQYIGGTFPVTPGAFQTNYGRLFDVAILKYDSLGQKLLYASYLGGSESESPHSLVMNDNQELLVLGTTSSSDFPTSVTAFDRTFNGGVPEANVIPYNAGSDIFVAKISKNGNQLLASSYFGGKLNDGLNPSVNSPLVRNYGDQLRGDIIADSKGDIFISTVTSSIDFPVTNSFGLTYKGGLTDALLLKLDKDLTQISWAAYLGGSLADASHTIQLDRDGNLFVGGGSNSFNFPTTSGSYQVANKGGVDGWIAKIKGDGSVIMKSTYTGTSLFNQVYFIDLDKEENVYVYGQTENVSGQGGATFPTSNGVYKNDNSGQFLQKFDNSLSTLIFSTVFGSGAGIPNISPTAFLVNDCNNIYLSGWGGIVNSAEGFWQSNTFGMVTTPDAFQKSTSGSDFYFIVFSSDASQLLYASYLGGTSSRTHLDGGTCRFDKGGVVYHAVCSGCAAFNSTQKATSDFPTTLSAWSRTNRSGNCNNAAFKFDLSSLKARIQTNSVKLNQPGLNKICLPDKIVFQNRSIGGQQYFWDFGDQTKQIKTDTSAIIHGYKDTGSYSVKLKITDAGTCVVKDSTYVKVSVFEAQGYAGTDKIMCFNAGTQLTAGGGVGYQWKNKDNTFTSVQATPTVNPSISDTYFVTITDVNGCAKKDTVNVKVVPAIDLKFKSSLVDYNCFNLPTLSVVNQTDPQEEVFFDFGDGTTSDQPQAIHQYAKDSLYIVKLVGKKENCVYEQRLEVPVFTLKVPNVITPGAADGENDFFKIQYGDAQARSSIHVSLLVYNRWGATVYDNKDYKDDWAATDIPAGIYYYEAAIQGITTCKSWLNVIK